MNTNILNILAKDARCSLEDIAMMTGLSKSEVEENNIHIGSVKECY